MDETCVCDHCGYKFKMPRLEDMPDLGTFDVASWGFCMPECLTAATGIRGELTIMERLYRPIFRWRQYRTYKQLASSRTNDVEKEVK